MTRQEYLYLTTIGRRSGLPREIEIWFTEHGGHHYVIAEHDERAQWVRNLKANAAVRFRVGNQTFQGHARVLDGAADAELIGIVRRLSEQKYGWGDGLVVELVPH